MIQQSEGGPVSAGLPDLVYVVGPGTSGHEELRHSLRSVAKNLPHRHVWIVGSIPDWVTSVKTIPLEPHPEKFENQRQSLTAACNNAEVSESFVLMNDDMFAIEPILNTFDLPVKHLGRSSEHLKFLASVGKNNDWVDAVTATAEWFGDPNCYECHIPLLFSRERLSAVLSAYPKGRPFAAGEAYEAARAGSEGVLGHCVKVTSQPLADKLGTPFLSSVEWSFAKGEVGRYVRSLFPQKCRYEL